MDGREEQQQEEREGKSIMLMGAPWWSSPEYGITVIPGWTGRPEELPRSPYRHITHT
jgi:hypothetical protein